MRQNSTRSPAAHCSPLPSGGRHERVRHGDRRGALRRRRHRAVTEPQGLPGTAGGPRPVPQRHSVHTSHTPDRGGRAGALARWGLLDDLDTTGCPPLEWTVVEAAGVRVEGCSPPLEGIRSSRAPRRIVLDNLLATASQKAGATFWDGCTVEGVLWEDDRVAGVRCRTPGGDTTETEVHAPWSSGRTAYDQRSHGTSEQVPCSNTRR
jgi:hypothetical protein